MWDLIVSVPDNCLSFYFGWLVSNCIIFMASASWIKIISGNKGKLFQEARYYFQGAREY